MFFLLLISCAGEIETSRYGKSVIGVFAVTMNDTRCDNCWVYEEEEPIGMANEELTLTRDEERAFRFGNVDPEERRTRDGYPLIETGYHGMWVAPEIVPHIETDTPHLIRVPANRYIEGNWTCWNEIDGPITADVSVTKGQYLLLPDIDAVLTLNGTQMSGQTSDGVAVEGIFIDTTTIDISLHQADGTQHVMCWEGEHQDMPRA